MPMINVKVSAAKSPELTAKISRIITELTVRILKKEPEVIAIASDYVYPDHWIVGGRSLTEQGKASIYYDVKVTDESNTKAEKAQYIKEAFAAFSKLLGNLHDETYFYVQDVRPTAYGYGGKTQDFRYQHPPAS
jgi:4-oxalocrotonate tautomerase